MNFNFRCMRLMPILTYTKEIRFLYCNHKENFIVMGLNSVPILINLNTFNDISTCIYENDEEEIQLIISC